MHIEFLLEEPSAEAALAILVPRILDDTVTCAFHVFQGKMDLLQHLPHLLRGYQHWALDTKIVILLDEDRQDCRKLKAQVDGMVAQAGLSTCHSSGPGVRVLNRIAVEELEAWYLGDVPALVAAFPGVPPTLAAQSRYRNPDAVHGGTWEALQRVLQKAGYCRAGMSKIDLARRVAPHMTTTNNQSRSFQVFVSGLLTLVGHSVESVPAP